MLRGRGGGGRAGPPANLLGVAGDHRGWGAPSSRRRASGTPICRSSSSASFDSVESSTEQSIRAPVFIGAEFPRCSHQRAIPTHIAHRITMAYENTRCSPLSRCSTARVPVYVVKSNFSKMALWGGFDRHRKRQATPGEEFNRPCSLFRCQRANGTE